MYYYLFPAYCYHQPRAHDNIKIIVIDVLSKPQDFILLTIDCHHHEVFEALRESTRSNYLFLTGIDFPPTHRLPRHLNTLGVVDARST